MTEAKFNWKCSACGHAHSNEVVAQDGPFCTLICSGCSNPFDSAALTQAESKAWGDAIKAVNCAHGVQDA